MTSKEIKLKQVIKDAFKSPGMSYSEKYSPSLDSFKYFMLDGKIYKSDDIIPMDYFEEKKYIRKLKLERINGCTL